MHIDEGWFRPNTYYFDSINEFSRCTETIMPTPVTLLAFGEKFKMEGLAYVVFNHRVSFNYNRENFLADLSDMNRGNNVFPVTLSKIKSNSGFVHGLTLENLPGADEEGRIRMTFGSARLIYQEKNKGLVLESYRPYKGFIDNIEHDDFDLPDRMGFS